MEAMFGWVAIIIGCDRISINYEKMCRGTLPVPCVVVDWLEFELPSSAVRFITSLLETARHLKLIL